MRAVIAYLSLVAGFAVWIAVADRLDALKEARARLAAFKARANRRP